MADFNNPLSNQGYLALLASIVENNKASLQMLEGVTPLTNLPTNAKRWNAGNARFEKWSGSAWGELAALFEMKVRNSDQLNGQTQSYYRNADNLNAGTLLAARFNDTSHGGRAGGSLHAAATTTVNGFMSAADKVRLNSMETGATADMTSAEILAALLPVDGPGTGINSDFVDNYHAADLLARNNHTGTQAVGTITGLGSLATLNQVPNNSIGQGQLKTAPGSASVAIATNSTNSIFVVNPAGAYGYRERIRTSISLPSAAYTYNGGVVLKPQTGSVTTFTSYISLAGASPGGGAAFTVYGEVVYVQASPPYDLGDGVVGRFIFALIDNETGKVEAVYNSTEAPWHYNGPTNIKGYVKTDGKKYRTRKDMSAIPFTLLEAQNDIGKLQDYTTAYKEAPLIEEEITQEIKQADMGLIPHPFMGNDLTGKTVVMLDPVSDLNHKLSEMCDNHDEFDLNGLLHDGHIKISNTGLTRSGPAGILIPSFSWKKTA